MNRRENIARWLSPLLGALRRSRTMVKFFLALGIFISANHIALLIRFGFNVPPNLIDVMRQTIPILVIAKGLGFLVSGRMIAREIAENVSLGMEQVGIGAP